MAATWDKQGPISCRSVQAATEAAPTTSSDGFALPGANAITIWVEADAGQTLLGGGGVDLYAYDDNVGGWGLAPLLPFSVPDNAAGARRCVLGTIVIDNPRGRLAPIANGVTVSGGGVTIYATATTPGRIGASPA